jgi:hypothetical protein
VGGVGGGLGGVVEVEGERVAVKVLGARAAAVDV